MCWWSAVLKCFSCAPAASLGCSVLATRVRLPPPASSKTSHAAMSAPTSAAEEQSTYAGG
eukprot:CAMPEP_0119094722 /NCGR_PEP_ID=MMETSP1178-20130426/167160_1 /TAXON_ID=33656 /ORGANISM="unid sp, Strain CCMP2000" /LENGTH=59 /DNA_ID=CAMNT_0007078467 /DNA_START=116 /DNA_END=291 /DNA_ORIENTATION=-